MSTWLKSRSTLQYSSPWKTSLKQQSSPTSTRDSDLTALMVTYSHRTSNWESKSWLKSPMHSTTPGFQTISELGDSFRYKRLTLKVQAAWTISGQSWCALTCQKSWRRPYSRESSRSRHTWSNRKSTKQVLRKGSPLLFTQADSLTRYTGQRSASSTCW